MSQLVKISFKDSQNWINSKAETINWDNLAEFYKDEEVAPHYLPPQIFEDTWNGRDHDVQHIRHDTYRLEIIAQSSELIELSRMQSCDTILIHDVNTGMPIQTVDMQKSEWLNFGEPERIANTSSWKLVLIYRTNKTIINKFIPLSTQVVIIGNSAYNSVYPKIAFNSPLQEIKVPWLDGNVVLEETNRTGYQVLFYFTDAEKEAFKNDYYVNGLTIDSTPVVEIAELEISQLGEDNWKVVATFITTITVTDKTSGLSNVVDLLTGSTHHYSKFDKIPYIGEIEQIRVRWDEGIEKLLRQTNDIGFRVLYYFSSSAFETFKNDWNIEDFTIDLTTIINNLPLEITQLESGNYQVIVSCVTTKDTDNKWTGATADTLEVNLNPYTTPFDKLAINIPVEKITFPWPDGSIRTLREINKKGFKFFFYYNEFGFETFKNDFNQYPAVVLPTTDVIEKLELEVNQDEYGYFQVIASVVTDVDENTYDLDPDNTHALVITDTGGPYTFHTDYATEANTPDAEKDPISNEDGLPVDAKIISRQVTDIKLFLNTADKNSLKFHYEKGTAVTIDTVAILYRGIVETDELAKDLWEVNIKGLTTTPDVNYPL